jgi:hypothetical protein
MKLRLEVKTRWIISTIEEQKIKFYQKHTIHDRVQGLKNAEDAPPHCLTYDYLKSFHGHCRVKIENQLHLSMQIEIGPPLQSPHAAETMFLLH